MEGDALALERLTIGNLQAPIRNELLDELGMVHHFIFSSEFRILVFEGIEAVRTTGNDAFDTVPVEHSDVLRGLHLKEELVARPLGGIARAAFFCAEHCKWNFSSIQNAGDGFCDALCTVVKAASATHPKEDLWGLSAGVHIGQMGDGQCHIGGGQDSEASSSVHLPRSVAGKAQGAPLFSTLLNIAVMGSGALESSMMRLLRMSRMMPMGLMLMGHASTQA